MPTSPHLGVALLGLVIPGSTDASGVWSQPVAGDGNTSSAFFVQAVVADGAQSQGFAFTNALCVRVLAM